MNKLMLFLLLALIGCTTTTAPKRTVLDCSEMTTDSQMVPKSKVKWCTYKQVPDTPKSTPIQVPSDLVK